MKIMTRILLGLIVTLTISACGSGSDFTYVAIGASDATGIGAEPPTEGYTFLIADRLDEIEDTAFLNLGIPGGETEEFVDVELPAATAANPDLVTIWAGPNDLVDGDTTEEFERNLDDLLSGLREDSDTLIVIGTIPDITILPRFQETPDPDVTAARIAAYNEIILRLAGQYGASIADLRQFDPTPNLVNDEDGFHPSNAGHAVIAGIYLDVIEPLLAK